MSASTGKVSLADALLLVTVTIWGVNFSVVKFALAELPPLAFNAVRFLVAAAALALVTRVAGRAGAGSSSWSFERRHYLPLIGLGLLGNTTYQLLFIYGADATSANNAALLLATVPAWVALMGTLAGMERVSPPGWVGVALSLAGIALLILGSDRGAAFRFGGATLGGDVLMLLATLCWSAYTLLTRFMMRHYGALPVTSFSTLVGALPLILLGLPSLVALEAVSAGAWAATVFSGLSAIALAYVFWNYGISHLGSARTALYSNLTPAFALVTAWLWLGETLTPVQAGGALLAIAGTVLARRHTRPLELAQTRPAPGR